ncbi:YveK family protein [Kallotenue papyrolyticum]|uniref:YveK family protein n=1 Tax=Kallotenue papyrolyticum TaxID=1325125 RepID=UPI0004785CAE|nr:GNVR domain-containing protein [Kallotenue papyrolyticum]
MDFITFFQAMLRGWWLIVLATLITVASAAYTVSRREPVYQATTKVELKPSLLLADPRQYIDAMNALDKRTTINTLANNAMGNSMQELVGRELGLPRSVIESLEIAAVVIPDTNLIEIRTKSRDPQLAAAVSNTIAEQLSRQVPARVIQVEITDRAVPPTIPVEPRPTRTITLGLLFGLALGIVFALLKHLLQTLPFLNAPTPQLASEPHKDEASRAERRVDTASTRQFFSNP